MLYYGCVEFLFNQLKIMTEYSNVGYSMYHEITPMFLYNIWRHPLIHVSWRTNRKPASAWKALCILATMAAPDSIWFPLFSDNPSNQRYGERVHVKDFWIKRQRHNAFPSKRKSHKTIDLMLWRMFRVSTLSVRHPTIS